MIWALRLLFLLVLIAQTYWVVHACLQQSLFQIPEVVLTKPWWVTTLWDIYFAFLPFCLWILYKENVWWFRLVWILLVLGLGSIAISAYLLVHLFRLKPTDSIQQLLVKNSDV